MTRKDGSHETLASVLGVFEDKLRLYWSAKALCAERDGRPLELTYDELAQYSLSFAADLAGRGLGRGDRLAILSESSPEWGICFFAAVTAGLTLVPLDPKLTEEELASILADCRPRALVASPGLRATAGSLAERCPGIEWTISTAELLSTEPQDSDSARARRPLPRPRSLEELALIVYTSGTTGHPKGVMITFGNLMFEVRRLEKTMVIRSGDCFLSFLPMNHLLELTGGFLSVLALGGTIWYASSIFPEDLAALMRRRRVTCVVGVPLVFKALQRGIEQRVQAGPAVGRAWFRAASWVARGIPSTRLRRWLFWPLHRRLGGRLRLFVSGGAPLDPEVDRFFDTIGVPILQGYGLTETGPVVTVNTPARRRAGSVGRPLSGVELRILRNGANAPDGSSGVEREGEILTRGPHVMRGYYNRPDLTREVLDEEGWFHTGDLGRLDDEGFLYVTGRLKSLIVLGEGQKVQPEEVEAALARGATFREACVVGRKALSGLRAGTEEVCVVAVPSPELRALHGDRLEPLRDAMRHEIEDLVRGLAPYKRPSRVLVSLDELPKTPSRKIKRGLVARWAEAEQSARPS